MRSNDGNFGGNINMKLSTAREKYIDALEKLSQSKSFQHAHTINISQTHLLQRSILKNRCFRCKRRFSDNIVKIKL